MPSHFSHFGRPPIMQKFSKSQSVTVKKLVSHPAGGGVIATKHLFGPMGYGPQTPPSAPAHCYLVRIVSCGKKTKEQKGKRQKYYFAIL